MWIALVAVLVLHPVAAQASSSASGKPKVVIAQRGFSVTRPAEETFITYGVKLVNRSKRAVAKSVRVKARFVDASGSPVASASQTITAIPAAGTFYMGGETETPVPASTVRRLRVAVTVRAGQQRRAVLPRVTHTTTAPDPNMGLVVSGVMTNPYKKPIYDPDGTACAVVFDPHGKILGGDCVPIGEATQSDEVAPRSTVGVEVYPVTDFPDVIAQVASGRISIDPGSSAFGRAQLGRRLHGIAPTATHFLAARREQPDPPQAPNRAHRRRSHSPSLSVIQVSPMRKPRRARSRMRKGIVAEAADHVLGPGSR
jgi:hypothetical protein